MAIQYTLNIDSPFLPKSLSKSPLQNVDSNKKLSEKSSKNFNLGKEISKTAKVIGNFGVKGAEVLGKGFSLIEPLLYKDKVPENKNALLANALGNTISNIAPTLGPAGWIYKGLYLGALGTGGMINGSDSGNTLADIGNTALGTVGVGWGWVTPKSPEYLSNDLTKSSMTYKAVGQFGEKHGGGKYFFNRDAINSGINQDNINTLTTVDSIIKPGQLDLISAMDENNYKRWDSDRYGGYNRVNNFGVNSAKQGAVLQFSKRILSKNKIKKQLFGGEVTNLQVRYPEGIPEKLPPFIHYNSNNNYFYTDVWGDSPQEHKDLLLTYVKYKFPKGWKVWYNPMVDDKDRLYSILPEALYNHIALKFVDRLPLGPSLSKISPYTINQWVPIEGKMLKYIGEDEDNITETGAPANFIDEDGNGYYYQVYKEGGKVNVIPEGALHKNKHHLEEIDEKFEDVTTKGIPVIVESEGGEVVQQAEVERQEIIFRLEVTKKLEELSKKHTDEAAIEAGKLLVKEILYNTVDNTKEMI